MPVYTYNPQTDRTDKAITVPESVLEDLKAKLKEQDAMLRKLTGLPLAHATVIAIGENSVTIVADGQIAEVELPGSFTLEVGSPVLINGQTKQIVRLAKEPQIGGIGVVKAVVDEHLSEVIIDGQNRVVINSTNRPKVGDQVVLSGGNMVIYAVLPQEQGQRFIRNTMADVEWDHVGGQRAAKEALKEAIVLPALHPDVFKFYGKGFPGGILLYGPPGNGKTLLGKASSTALRRKGEASGFFSIKGPEVLDAYVGETERKIRELFKAARNHKLKTGSPAVIFIDEAEALLTARGQRGMVGSMSGTVVPTFLAEMDGIEESSAIVMLATNRPEQLDPAIARDGRMDRKIEVARPTADDAGEILGVHLRNIPAANGEDAKALGAAIVEAIYSKSAKTPTGKKLVDIVSGAMLAAIVEHGKSFAMQRDLAKGGKPSGVTKADMLQAIERIKVENTKIAHAE